MIFRSAFFTTVVTILFRFELIVNGDDFDLLLLHANDLHARFEQADVHGNICTDELAASGKCYGGFARMKKLVDDFRTEAAKLNTPSVFLYAGDTFQGTPYYNVFKWKIAADLLKTLDFDAMCLGNHEFDGGVEDLSMFLKNISDIVPVVAVNVNVTLEPSLNLKPSTVLTVNGNKKIGVIGYLRPGTKDPLLTGRVEFSDEIEVIGKEARRLKSEGVNILIALGHSGFEKDVEIAREIPEISLVVGGHSHSLLYNPKDHPPSTETVTAEYPFMVTQKSGRKVPVVQSYCNSKYLGKLTVKFDDNGAVLSAVGNSILLDGSFGEDAYVLEKLAPYKTELRKVITPVLGKTNVYLTSSSAGYTPLESNFGNMVADAFVDYVTRRYNGTEGWTKAPIGLCQSRIIRTDIDNRKNHGNITYGDMMTAMPYDNTLVTADIGGDSLRELLEYAVSDIFLTAAKNVYVKKLFYLSGVKVVYDLSRKVGHRIKSLKIRCGNCTVPMYEDLCLQRRYTIVTYDFLLDGGGNYDVLKEKTTDREYLGISSMRAVAEYIEHHSIVYPGLEDRIVGQNIDRYTGSSDRISGTAVTAFIVSLISFVFTKCVCSGY